MRPSTLIYALLTLTATAMPTASPSEDTALTSDMATMIDTTNAALGVERVCDVAFRACYNVSTFHLPADISPRR